MNLNFGDFVILFMIGAGFAGMAALTVYEMFEKRGNNEDRSRAEHLAEYEAEEEARHRAPEADVSDRGEYGEYPE